MDFKRKPTPERMLELISRANNPALMISKKGKEHLVHAYSNDVSELIVYIRELEAKLNIERIYK